MLDILLEDITKDGLENTVKEIREKRHDLEETMFVAEVIIEAIDEYMESPEFKLWADSKGVSREAVEKKLKHVTEDLHAQKVHAHIEVQRALFCFPPEDT